MTKLVLDHNPLSGETVYFEFDNHSDEIKITHEQEVSKHLDLAHAIASDTSITDRGIKDDMWRYAHVPNTVILEMKSKHGVDFFDKNDSPRVFALLETEYKRFKTTTKTHRPRHG
jgi:hypothetical protein